jgi:hypothetical protein
MRLIAFGCSNTYGQGLPDCHFVRNNKFEPGPHPSKHAWPQQLGKLLNADSVINMGQPGASNKQISTNALNFEFEPNDFVVCHWSLIHRNCVFYPDKDTLGLGLWDIPEKAIGDAYQRYIAATNSDYNLMIESCHYINHTHLYIEPQVKHLYHVVFRAAEFYNLPSWTRYEFICDAGYYNRIYPVALDGCHTGVQGHKELAKNIFDKHIGKELPGKAEQSN